MGRDPPYGTAHRQGDQRVGACPGRIAVRVPASPNPGGSACGFHVSPVTRRGSAPGEAAPVQGLQKRHARSSGFPQFFALTPVFPGRSVRDRCPLDLVVSLDAKPYRLGSHPSSTTRRRHGATDLAGNARAGQVRAEKARHQRHNGSTACGTPAGGRRAAHQATRVRSGPAHKQEPISRGARAA